MRRLFFILLLLSLLFPATAICASVNAFVSRNTVSEGESLTLSVVIEGEKGEVDLTPLTDFDVISRSTNTSVRIINTRMTREVIHKYLLLPLKKGKAVIPKLTVTAGKETLETEPIIVRVVSEGTGGDKAANLFVRAEVSEAAPWSGQQFLYTFKLFSRYRIANAKLEKPGFKGFVVKEIEENRNYRKVLNGMEYSVNEVNYLLIPIQSGQITIDPAVLTLDLVQKRRNSFDSAFDDSFFGRSNLIRKVLKTMDFQLPVKPLPPFSGEGEFSGLVGKIDLSASLETRELEAGGSTTLSVIISGKGNIMDAGAPSVPVPDSFKVYNDTAEEKISADESGYAGEKIFRMAVVPVKAGNFSIGPVGMNYFDPVTGAYQVRSVGPFPIRVTPSAETAEAIAITETKPAKGLGQQGKTVEITGRDILGLKDEITAIEDRSALGFKGFCLLLVLPAALYLMLRLLLTSAGKGDSPQTLMRKRSVSALKRAKDCDPSDPANFTDLYTALTAAVFSRAGMPGANITGGEVRTLLTSCGIDESIAQGAAELLSEIEAAQYSGNSMNRDHGESLYRRTGKMVRSIMI